MPSIVEILESRGFLNDCTDAEGLKALAAKERLSVYCGFDPTADSLHIGNMVAIMGLKHFQLAGHRPLVLMGGATGMIGDPSGKSAERNLQTNEQVRANLAAQRPQFGRFLSFEGENAAKIVNNYDWFQSISFIDFLRDAGKSFRIGEMLGKESVRARLNSEAGLSYTEFSYMLLQAYDFSHLFEAEGCKVQCGGADQWGNITAGMDLIRKTRGEQAYGITFPLLTTATGQKLGKTEKGAVWLDAAKTSPFDFYQYWVRCEDADVERFLKMFTLLDLERIDAIVAEHRAAPESRSGQRQLAWEVTCMVHGEAEAAKARAASEALYGGGLQNLSDDELAQLFPNVPSVTIEMPEDGAPVADVLVQAGLTPSKKEARKLLQQGGLYLNNVQVEPERRVFTKADLASDTMLVLRAGKKRYCLVKIAG
ncbi:MAG: tyrosyl-tRNA synthetase [Candidatus Sumerlaeota bacterium]|nr:tyrosyl-tRNA synthetase [Candidatus Sumerlaeota bacterium]